MRKEKRGEDKKEQIYEKRSDDDMITLPYPRLAGEENRREEKRREDRRRSQEKVKRRSSGLSLDGWPGVGVRVVVGVTVVQ